MTLKEIPYWWDTAAELPREVDRPLPARVDVAVIGGGYTGLSAARTLAKAGVSVVVLEKEHIGWGASSRNGGQVLSGLKKGIRTLIARYGLDAAQRMFNASVQAIDYVEQLIVEEQIDCGFVRCGSIGAASKPAHFESYKKNQELLARDFDYHIELVPRAEQQRELGSEAYHGVYVDTHNASLHPARYVRGLAQAAQRAGVDLHEATPVTAMRRAGRASGFEVITPRGTVRADHVLAATNGYTSGATPFLRRRVLGIGSYIVATEPLPEAVAQRLLPQRRVVSSSKNFLHYFRLSEDNRLLFGGRAQFAPSTPQSTRQSVAILRRDMAALFPELRDVQVEYVWSGNVCFSMDMMPHAGRSTEGLHYALGYGGHGVALATHTGMQIACAMLGRGATPFDDLSFHAIPFYEGRPWFLPFAGLWFKFLDWIQ